MHEYSSDKQKSPAAGVIVLKSAPDLPDGFMVLCLLDDDGFDLPKGMIEPFENEFVAAVRETDEESGITNLDFRWGMVTTQVSNVTLYIAVTNDEPHIRPNPETGEYEHYGAQWLALPDASTMLRHYLRPAMKWACDIVGAH